MVFDKEIEALMRRYLLGELPEADRRRVEELYFDSDDQFELISMLEAELVDDYADGTLSSEERESFERNYLVTEERRQRVDFSRQLLTKARQRRAFRKWPAFLASALRTRIAVPRWAALMATVVLTLTAWWSVRLIQHSNQVQRRLDAEITRNPAAALSPNTSHAVYPITLRKYRPATPEDADGPITGSAAGFTTKSGSGESPKPAGPMPNAHKAVDSAKETLPHRITPEGFAIPSEAQVVELILPVPTATCANKLTGELYPPLPSWRARALCSGSGKHTASFYVPAALLSAGHNYEVSLYVEDRLEMLYWFAIRSR